MKPDKTKQDETKIKFYHFEVRYDKPIGGKESREQAPELETHLFSQAGAP